MAVMIVRNARVVEEASLVFVLLPLLPLDPALVVVVVDEPEEEAVAVVVPEEPLKADAICYK